MPAKRPYQTSGPTVNILGQYLVNPITLTDGETYPLQVDQNGNLKAVLTGTSNNSTVIVSGRTTMVGATITRSANTTAYSINQVVANANGTILTFTNLARITGGSGYITKARLITNQLNNTASFRLHLFHTAPTSQTDGSAYQLLWANRDKAIGTIDIPALTSEGAGGSTDSSRGINSDIRLAFSGGATADIFVIVQTLSAFTPTSGQFFYLELTAENN